MDRRGWTVTAVVVALVLVSVGVAAVTGLGGSDDDPPTPTSVVSAAAVEAFLEDFEGSLTATFVSRSTFERFRGEQRVTGADLTVVQRPPDRLTSRDRSVSGQLDGRAVSCTGTGDDVECLVGSEPVDAAAEVAAQLATVRDYVTGPDPLYGVAATDPTDVSRVGGTSDRCYSLELLRQLPVAPYGTFARFCFDAGTGAPTLLRIERPEAIDITTAIELHDQVTDDDLRLPV